MTGSAGNVLVDALVALGLVALAAGVIAAVSATSGRLLVVALQERAATELVRDRLDALRGGPRIDGSDAVMGPCSATFSRAWAATAGRGRPDRLSATVVWPGHAVSLATEALP